MNDKAIEAQGRNIQRVMSNDGPPRIRAGMEQFAVAKDTAKGMVLVGGLGAMGVGKMWCQIRSDDDLVGFDEAPEVDYEST